LTKGNEIEREFTEQLDAYHSDPKSSFYDARIERQFLEQKLRHLAFKPYPKDGLVTFGASGTNKCDREIVFKNSKVKPEKSPDEPHRGRQRSQGSSVVDFRQLDLLHMPKRLGTRAKFRIATTEDGEFAMEDAAQLRKVFEVNGVKFAITAKPDGIFDYEDRQLLFEFKTKATGLVAMNSKLDFTGAQADHLRQVTAESLLFGITEGLLVYESTEKPSWFSDEDKKYVPKTRKTWREGRPLADVRPFYFEITKAMQNELLFDLAEQARLVYVEEVPEMDVEMTNKCGFCPFRTHCKTLLTDGELTNLREIEAKMAKSHMAGKYEHRNLVEFLREADEVRDGE
jgi:hypothetical protein